MANDLSRFQRLGVPGIFVILWSSGFIGAKLGLPYAEPLTFLLWRYAIVTVLFLALVLWQKAPWPATVRETLHIAVAGVLVNAVYIGCVFSSIAHGLPAGIASLIVGLQPLFTAVLASRLLGEKVYGRQWVGFALGMIGLILVLGNKVSFAGGTITGVLLAVIALVGITVGTLYQKRYCGGMNVWSGGVIQFASCTVVMAVSAPLLETMKVTCSGGFIVAMLLMLSISLCGVTLLNIIIRRGEVARIASLFFLVPPTTTVLAFLFFGERLGGSALFGMAVSVTGVALATRPPARARQQAVELQSANQEERQLDMETAPCQEPSSP
jgi:drug/metabolite transporter (DMT)-like permease